MLDSPASTDDELVRYRTKPGQFSIFLARYRTEIDARVSFLDADAWLWSSETKGNSHAVPIGNLVGRL